MTQTIPSRQVHRFIDSFVAANPDLFGFAKDSDSFTDRIEQFLLDFVEAHNRPVALVALSHENSLSRICDRGIDIKTVIDVGASDGQWSAKIQERFFTEANFFLIEGYDHWREALERRKASRKNFDYVVSAAGDEVGTIYYCERPDHPTGGHAYHRKIDERYKETTQTTIDFEVQKRELEGPFMVKLDCHGQEREILKGAAKTLEKTELLMVEVYNYADRGRMRFHELCEFAEDHGFRCVDLAEPHFMEEGYSKNADLSLWAMDLFFVRADRPEFKNREGR